MFFRKLVIIVWKNLLLRKRQYIITTFEVVLPLLVALFLALLGLGRPIHKETDFTQPETTSEVKLKSICKEWCRSNPNPDVTENPFLVYMPKNPETTRVVEQVVDELCANTTNTIGLLPVDNATDLKHKCKEKEDCRAAIVFPDKLDALQASPSDKNATINYEIRMKKFRTNNLLPIQTPRKCKWDYDNDFTKYGPNLDNRRGRYQDFQYIYKGFLGLQIAIEKVLIRMLTGNANFDDTVSLRNFPFPPYISNKYGSRAFFFNFFVGIFGFFLIFMIPSITRNVVGEKQSGMTELLRSVGVGNWIQSLGWLIHATAPYLITVSLVTVFFCAIKRSDDDGTPVLGYSDGTVVWVFLFLSVVHTAAFFCFICSLFQKPVAATIVAILIWVITGLLMTFEIGSEGYLFNGNAELFFCMFPVVAYVLAMRIIAHFDYIVVDDSGQPYGAQWNRINEPCPWNGPDSRDASSSTLLEIMIMQLFYTTMYMLLAMYFEYVLPSDYGVKRPCYFFNLKETQSQSQVSPGPPSSTGGATSAAIPNNVGIDVQYVAKCFGNKVAVNGVSLQMYSGDIFALLGHNGAGKTTLISIITGWAAPTQGTVLIEGVDIRDNLDKARAKMGLCPQHNMLFDHLTVSEHLCFFGMLRGQKMKAAKQEAKMLLARMNFAEKAKTSAKKLSGGQKRKLSLGMALIGGTKVVVLDEPTSGMDPQARREIWDLLLELRGERTILLTTHFMEEADVLGDRIGIMAGGTLQCIGTPAYLKKFYGKGYSLKVTLEQMSKEEIGKSTGALLATVKTHIPDATLDSNVRSDPSSPEVALMLPTETATTKSLGAMFSDLTANRAKLKIKTMGLSQTSMEDVFLKVGELTDGRQQSKVEVVTAEDANANAPIPIPMANEETAKAPKVKSGSQLVFCRFTALLMKRCIHFIRKWGLLISQTFLPFVLFLIIVHVMTALAEPRSSDNSGYSPGGVNRQYYYHVSERNCPIPMTLDSYNDPVTFYNATAAHTNVKSVIGPSGQYYGHVVNDLLVRAERNLQNYKRRFIVALDVNIKSGSDPSEVIAMYNTYPYHSAPLAVNLASNVILKYLEPNATRTIRLTSRPIGKCEDDKEDRYNSRFRQSTDSKKQNIASYGVELMASLLPLALLVIVTCFIVGPIEEKMCQAKQLQTMSGASPLLYWGSFLTFDYSIYFLMTFLMLIYMLIFDWHQVYTYGAGGIVFFIIVMTYGFAGILFSYLFSLNAGSVAGSFILVMLIHVVTGCAMGLKIPESNPGSITLFLIIIARFFPTYSLTRALVRFGYISVENSNCHLLNNCEPNQTPTSYLTWTLDPKVIRQAESYRNDDGDIVEATVPGILQDLVILFCMGVNYGVLLTLIEYKVWRYFCRKQLFPTVNYPNDDDVQNEADRVNNLIANGQTNQDCLLVQNLSKSYGKFAAVKSITFGVHHGECFGLLGVNGAGKTTAFRMLTGDEVPTAGEAYGFNTSLNGNAARFFSNIGYCPQFDGFIPDFSGKQMLQLFAGLRGVPFGYRKTEAMKWLTKVGLWESANVRCKNYSGGMKRRLTTAMALIGDPAMILLDEPTSGVDPVSRRQFWKILDRCRDSGQSVILTSHSMEECEALCSRLAIMVNGEFQCFGGVQHLKNKFAQGYSLILKLKTENFPPGSPERQERMDSLNKKVTRKFDPCTLKDQHQNLVQYHLQDASITWDVLFKTLEKIKSEFEDFIEDFAVNETSLEEVFLAFARAQYPERKATNTSCIIRFFTCRW